MCLSAVFHVRKCESLYDSVYTCLHLCVCEWEGGGELMTLSHAALLLMEPSTRNQVLSRSKKLYSSR